jgi:Ser/Thr protein kinase RdoA (MazF antagonist)
MHQFPVTNSTLSAEHLALFLREKYSLSTETKCRITRAGINDTYSVTDGTKKFVLRVYKLNWRSEKEIAEEIRLLAQLQDMGILVSYAIADSAGNYVQTFDAPEGLRFGVLFSYAEGRKIISFPAEMHFTIGEFMARLHKITENQKIARTTYTPEVFLVNSLQYVAEFLPEETEEMQYLQKTKIFLLAELATAKIPELRQGIVHLDIWFDNLNITDDGAITLFDFDFCGNGWLDIDIAYYLLMLHFVETKDDEIRTKSESFLAGYESITKLSAEEKRLLPALGASLSIFYIGVNCQRFDNYSNQFLSQTYLRRYIIARIKKFIDFHALMG